MPNNPKFEKRSTNVEKITKLLRDVKIDGEIDGKIDNMLGQLEYLNKNSPERTDTNVNFQLIAEGIEAGKIDDTYIADQYFHINYTEKDPKIKLTKTLLLAHIYTYTAIQLKNHNDLMMAWNAISEACSYIGACNVIHEALEHPKTNRASKGGKANAKKTSDFKDSVIKALHSFRPKNGWSSSSMAADKIIDHLINSSPPHKGNHAEDRNDLIAKIRNMIQDDRNVKMAFTTPN